MLLALLNPLLDCEQLRALKLTKKEASTCVSLLRKAVEDPYHLVEDFSLLTILRSLVWFVHEYHRQDKDLSKKKACSEYESKLVSISQELRSNIELLVEEGVLSAVKVVLKLDGKEEFRAVAAKLLWCLAHNTIVKAQILSDADLVGILKEIEKCSSTELNMASNCLLWLLDLQHHGM